jgi:hypothetical protein
MISRQARLRAPFSDWYSRITPGHWHHAVWVGEMGRANQGGGEPQRQERGGQRVG